MHLVYSIIVREPYSSTSLPLRCSTMLTLPFTWCYISTHSIFHSSHGSFNLQWYTRNCGHLSMCAILINSRYFMFAGYIYVTKGRVIWRVSLCWEISDQQIIKESNLISTNEHEGIGSGGNHAYYLMAVSPAIFGLNVS
jgi:hypothetical protein